jgi:uncharacterized protein (TIGR02145 family)
MLYFIGAAISALIYSSCSFFVNDGPICNKDSEIPSKDLSIGAQKWMSKNLDVAEFRNGDPIPEVKTWQEWIDFGGLGQPAWCYYLNDSSNNDKYGKLYNWYAVNDPRGLAPVGWHIPSDEEWQELADYLGGDYSAGERLKSASGWVHGRSGTDEFGFNALPGGRRSSLGDFEFIGEAGFWWSSTGVKSGYANAYYRKMYSMGGGIHRGDLCKLGGYSVRCLKD